MLCAIEFLWAYAIGLQIRNKDMLLISSRPKHE